MVRSVPYINLVIMSALPLVLVALVLALFVIRQRRRRRDASRGFDIVPRR